MERLVFLLLVTLGLVLVLGSLVIHGFRRN